MRRTFGVAIVLAVLAGTVAPAAATDRAAAVIAKVHQFIDGFDAGDAKSALAACAPTAHLIDEFPPYEWHGPGACARWADAYAADAAKSGVKGGIVRLAAPTTLEIVGDRAYVVVPATYTYELRGKPMAERGSRFTVSLRAGSSGWLIEAWAWSKG